MRIIHTTFHYLRLGSLWLVLAGCLLLAYDSPRAGYSQELNRAGVVVQYGDGSVVTRCVSFSGATISGIELLEQSGLGVATRTDAGLGAFVCRIGAEGCPAENCACAYPPTYWHYWLRDGESWQFAPVGASSRQLQPGAVDGWVWTGETTPPPDLTFAEICPATAPLTYPIYLPRVERAR